MRWHVGMVDEEAQGIVVAQPAPIAFAVLYETHNRAIYRYALHLNGNIRDAEAITAQTFTKALLALPTFEWRTIPFEHWLYRIARNTAFDAHRLNRYAPIAIIADLLDSAPLPQTQVLRRERAAEVREAVQQLPAHQRQAVYAHFSRGLTNTQIAQHLRV